MFFQFENEFFNRILELRLQTDTFFWCFFVTLHVFNVINLSVHRHINYDCIMCYIFFILFHPIPYIGKLLKVDSKRYLAGTFRILLKNNELYIHF